jgi:hypothetical protein
MLSALLADRKTEGLRFGRHNVMLGDIIHAIAENIGFRPAGSIAETKAAAYMSSLWQKADVLHWTDTFQAHTRVTSFIPTLTMISVLAVFLVPFQGLLALCVAVVGLVFAIVLLYADVPPTHRGKGSSQNVVALRKSILQARRRVVFLAPLDTISTPERWMSLRRSVFMLTIQVALLLVGVFDPLPLVDFIENVSIVWLTVLPASLFVAAYVAESIQRREYTHGALSHASALATMACALDEFEQLQHTEVWAVAVGASSTHAGILDLIQRYPFDGQSTFFITLAGLGRGTFCYTVQEGYDRGRSVDPLLLELATEMSPVINIEARVSKQSHLLRMLLRRQYRAIELTCLDDSGFVPFQGHARDTAEVVSLPILERAVRACVMLVKSIDALN